MNARTALFATAAAGVLTAAASGTAFGAIAGLQDDQLVSTTLEDVQPRIDRLAQTRVRVSRVDIFWSEVAPTRPANPTDPGDRSYVWTRADAMITGLMAKGIRPIVSVYSTPRWSSGGRFVPTTQYNPHAPSAGDYGRFMQAVAKRYSGKYRDGLYGNRLLPEVRHFEIWNEPNIVLFLRQGSRPSQSVYLRLLREAYPAIKKQNPRAIVIAGVGAPRSSTGKDGIGARRWLQGIVNAPLSVKFDAYSQHIYPAAPPISTTKAFPSWNSVSEILAILDERRAREIRAARGAAKAKLRKAPKYRLFITEAGYTTKRTGFRKVLFTEAQQARFMRQIYNLKVVKTPRVPVIIWFNFQDNPDWPGGLLRANLTRKPSYAVFTSLVRKGTVPLDLRR